MFLAQSLGDPPPHPRMPPIKPPSKPPLIVLCPAPPPPVLTENQLLQGFTFTPVNSGYIHEISL